MEQAALRLKDKVFSLFEPDALLPVQYFETLRRKVPLEPEKRLMWAILEDAVGRYRRYLADPRDTHSEEFSEVESWITESDSDWFCSFDNVCETLGIEPQYLRRGLLAWKEKQLAAGRAEKIARVNPVGSGVESRCVAGESVYERLTAAG
jgi:hypothetical protein